MDALTYPIDSLQDTTNLPVKTKTTDLVTQQDKLCESTKNDRSFVLQVNFMNRGKWELVVRDTDSVTKQKKFY